MCVRAVVWFVLFENRTCVYDYDMARGHTLRHTIKLVNVYSVQFGLLHLCVVVDTIVPPVLLSKGSVCVCVLLSFA